jgi:hypothetical protein
LLFLQVHLLYLHKRYQLQKAGNLPVKKALSLNLFLQKLLEKESDISKLHIPESGGGDDRRGAEKNRAQLVKIPFWFSIKV